MTGPSILSMAWKKENPHEAEDAYYKRLTILRREITDLLDDMKMEPSVKLAAIRVALRTDEHLAEKLVVEV